MNTSITDASNSLEIAQSRSKLIMMLMAAVAFVAIGFWFVIAPPVIQNSYWGNPIKLAVAGYASIVFFGLCVFFFIRKLFDSKPGLIIDDQGIFDNSSAVAAGHILWADITGISVVQIYKQKLVMLHVKDPQIYIQRQTSFFKRKNMEMNNRLYGTPLSISANGLKIAFDDLLTILDEKLKASGHQ